MKDFIGQTLGQYHLESLLGTGGMGQVYRGIHKLLERPAAIKVMLPHFAANPQFRARFLQEAKVVAALRHPNIVEIYEFGEQDGVLFLVMELMNDGSLSTLLRRQNGQPLPLSLALDLAAQTAEGLAAAHKMQIIHRDIKPANLLLHRQPDTTQGREHYTVKVNDFGLARLLDGGVETVTGSPMGTLAYMSPEQCLGNKQIDGRADLYSLGVVLYEMTTGYQPFQITGVSDALYKHVNTPPPSPRSMRSDLPIVVEEIIMRCLAKKPEERFATGTALSTALRNALGNTEATMAATNAQSYTATRTTLEAPVVAATPPTVATMSGYSDVPRVRVLDQNGQTLQVVELKPQGIIVGRQNGNNIVLDSHAVSRQHLQISWDGRQAVVKDLRSSNGTILGETRLLPDVAQVWDERQMLRIGSFWLRLESASAPLTRSGPEMFPRTPLSSVAANNATTVPAPLRSGFSSPSLVNERIGLTIAPKTLSITPGQPVTAQITLTNMGSTVDWFTPEVEGVPPEWVQGSGQEVQLNPGMQDTVPLIINVARNPINRAREYPVTIRARSREQPQQFSSTRASWTVQPFKEDALRLEPRRAVGRGKAVYSLALRNGSNLAARYTLSGDDDEQQLSYQFQYNPVDLDVGQEARIPLRIETKRHLIGREARVPFQLHAGPINSAPTQTVPGEFVNRPLLPVWVIPVVAAVLAASLVAASFLGLLPGHSKNIAGTPTAIVRVSPTTGPTSTPSPGATSTPTGVPSATATLSPTPTPVPTPPVIHQVTPISTGLGGAVGSQYVASQDSLYFTEYSGKLSVLRNISSGSPSYTVLGTGYTNPEDVYITADGGTAYITERSGDLVRVNLAGDVDRSSATVVASGLNSPQQMAIDEAHQIAYVVDYANPGSLISINLTNGNQTPILTNLVYPIGVLLSPDDTSIYITEQTAPGGTLTRYSLTSPGTPGTPLATVSSSALFFLSWADASQDALLVTERNPTNKVWYLSLQPGSALQLLANVDSNPSSVVVASPSSQLPMLVCTDSEVEELT